MLLWWLFFSYVLALSNAKRDVGLCRAQKTCGACITASPHCNWCLQKEYIDKHEPCDFKENLKSKGCDNVFIVDPENVITPIHNFSLADSDSDKAAIQIRPQNISIKIRPGKPLKFNLTFRQAENYPVDLYYLMDLSKSMKDDKDKLAKLGKALANRMNTITSNFHLGFGSFVDKVTMPYVNMMPSKLQSPCPGCVSPYSFKHQMELNRDPTVFEKKVRDAPISGNLDAPESGFDAIVQAVKCREIGWRPYSRKMILYSTDSSSHIAGDGRLGGIVEPNDGACHLDSNGVYNMSLEQDYPSLGQIASIVSQNKVNVIFAVTASELKLYENFARHLQGSSVGELKPSSGNIVDLVEINYRKITSKIELNVLNAEGLKVKLRSKCLKKNGQLKDTNICDGLLIGQSVDFEVEIEAIKCPKTRKKWKSFLEISAVGLLDALGINVELICECDCEKEKPKPRVPTECKGRGEKRCGVCICDKSYTGVECQCDGTDDDFEKFQEQCMKPGTNLICMGRGTCNCGVCQCDINKSARGVDGVVLYEGKYCDCNNFGCSYHSNGLMCGGPKFGHCNCGTCVCEEGWTDDACDCTTNNATCVAAANGKLCNGLTDDCRCGRCRCPEDSKFSGPACDECPTCAKAKCDQSVPCVKCRVFETGELNKDECEAQCPYMKVVNEIHLDNLTENDAACYFSDEDQCQAMFVYRYLENGSLAFTVKKEKECPEPVNVLAIVLGVIGGIVLLGLLILLIWKLIAVIQDRREFAKFEKMNENARWDTEENPIYKKATSTFKNPTYQAKG